MKAHDIEHLRTRLAATTRDAQRQKRFRNNLKTLLLIIAVVGFGLGLFYYGNRLDERPVQEIPGDRRAVIKRIVQLENELKLLQTELEPTNPPGKYGPPIRTTMAFAVKNWALLSFLGAIAIALFVKLAFDIDFFESYRDLSTTKQLSEFYRELGDRMMVYCEWEAAENAYRTASEIRPTNARASYGTAKASVFQPMKGQTMPAPEIADAKLAYLETHFANDYEVWFLKALRFQDRGETDNAKTCLQKALELNPEFVGGYLHLGYISNGNYEIEDAIGYYTKALGIDPAYSFANNNLGFCYLLLLDFPKAIEHLDKAWRASPLVITAINLGDAYRYSGKFDQAHQHHLWALNQVSRADASLERFAQGEWTWNFMPSKQGDKETIRNYVKVFTLEAKKAFASYALAYDEALLGRFAPADNYFAAASQLDPAKEYARFFVNKMETIIALLDVSPEARQWFQAKIGDLSG